VFDRISNSWQLVKASFNILRSDRELMLFPIVSSIGTIIVTVVFFIPLLATGVVTSGDASGNEVLLLILAFLFYFAMYTVIIFSNTALVSAAMMRMRGEKPTVRDGFRMASERIGPILGYAAISATVGVILNMLRDEENFLGQIVASIVSVAWNLITFLVIPVLVVENVGPIEAIKRSGSLLKRTWGEQVVGSFGIGMVVFLISLAVALVIGGPLVWLASLTGSDIAIALAIGVVVIIVMGINLVGTAMNGIFQAALYNYATTGEDEFFEEGVLRGAFQPK
jgi:hypothetical protein